MNGRGLHSQGSRLVGGRRRPEISVRPAMVLCAVAVLAIINPLVCVLHCHFASNAASAHAHQVGFVCDLPQYHQISTDTANPSVPAATPRAVYELASVSIVSALAVALLIAFMPLIKQYSGARPAAPPLLPPPRIAG